MHSWWTRLLFLTLVLYPRAAASAAVTLGTHLGMGVITTDRAANGSTGFVAWPSNPLTYQPAMRLAISDENRANSIQFDTGLLFLDQSGSSLSFFLLMVGYERALQRWGANQPFASAGFGVYREGSPLHIATATTYGFGLGFRHVIHDSHGAVRAEARFDHLQRAFGRPTLTEAGLRMGFDLWL